MLQTRPSLPKETLRYGLIVLVVGFFFFPIFWMLLTSFKPAEAIMVSPPQFFFEPTLDNFKHALYEKNFLFYVKNTLIISVISTAIVIFVGSLAAYSFARYNVGDGHLMGAPEVLDLLAVEFLRAGPALGRAEHDHRPTGPEGFTAASGLLLYSFDFEHRLLEGHRHRG